MRHFRALVFNLLLVLCLTGCSDDDPVEVEDAPDVSTGDSGMSEDMRRPVEDAGDDAGVDMSSRLAWPNDESQAASDPWIIENHDRIEVMRPRIMALNFVNARSNDEMVGLMEDITAAIREATRYHGYEEDGARPFLEYEIAYAVDMTDESPPQDWEYENSTLYPREDPKEGYWSFDYEKLFTEEYAEHFGVEDPDNPGEYLTLCELSERGLVHEVWVYGSADVPDVSAAEVLGIMPRYDENFERLPDELDRCAGNGCFDEEDEFPAKCSRTLRIGWVNNTRGVGCYLESLSHGIEWIANGDHVPYWTPYWKEFAGFDFAERYGVGFDSWYDVCSGQGGCLEYPTQTSVQYAGSSSGTIDPYVPVCGNAHFPPNGGDHYDIANDATVSSTCRSYRTAGGPTGGDPAEPVTSSDWSQYSNLAPDCTGAWIVWWWQNFPGYDSPAQDGDGQQMKNWWPFLFY